MGKIVPIRIAKERGLMEKESSLFVKFSPISLLLAISAIIIEIYLTAKYLGKDSYGNYTLLLLVFGIIGIIGVAYLKNHKNLFEYQVEYLRDWSKALLFIVSIISLVYVISIMMFLLQVVFRFALSVTDLYMYYIAGAIIEELFFRMFLISFFMLKTKIRYFGIIISSALFMVAHWEVYGHSISMMLAMFFGGIIFGIYYVIFKDITITMSAHVIINLIAVGNLLLQVS